MLPAGPYSGQTYYGRLVSIEPRTNGSIETGQTAATEPCIGLHYYYYCIIDCINIILLRMVGVGMGMISNGIGGIELIRVSHILSSVLCTRDSKSTVVNGEKETGFAI